MVGFFLLKHFVTNDKEASGVETVVMITSRFDEKRTFIELLSIKIIRVKMRVAGLFGVSFVPSDWAPRLAIC